METSRTKKTLFSLFDPSGKHRMTAILIGCNVLVFVLMALSGVNVMMPGSADLLHWGANYRPYTLNGEPWRLLTCCFVHIGLFHLLFNMYALLFIGMALEPGMGKWKFATAYLLTGILASLASTAWHNNTVSAGASGAIFGMFGVYIALLKRSKRMAPEVKKLVMKQMLLLVGINLAFGLTGLVDNAAHIGGLVSGLLLGYAYFPALRHPPSPRLGHLITVVAIAVVAVICIFAYSRIPNNLEVYNQLMKSLYSRDSLALQAVRDYKDLPRGAQRNDMKQKALSLWKQNENLLSEWDSTGMIPEAFHKRTQLLLLLSQLRIQYAQLVYQDQEEGGHAYDDQIRKINQEIAALQKESGLGPD